MILFDPSGAKYVLKIGLNDEQVAKSIFFMSLIHIDAGGFPLEGSVPSQQYSKFIFLLYE
jgi:hypothetical protein